LSFARQREIRFVQAATRLTLPLNRWVRVVTSSGGNEVFSSFMVAGRGEQMARVMTLEVMVRVDAR